MRIIKGLGLSIVIWACAVAAAQNVTVSVGAITKYSGIVADKRDVSELKSINEFLNTIESQLAQGFVDHGEIDYLDRMNTESVFDELHLSSQAAFNPTSGALRGLMGRLDFLVVIDSAEPSTARIRLIDVESGGVRAVQTCNRPVWGFGKTAPFDCIAPFVEHSLSAANAKRDAKSQRARQEAEAIAAANKQAALDRQKAEAEAKAREKQAAQDRPKAETEAEAREKQQAEAARQAAETAVEQARVQAETDKQIAEILPSFEDLESRLTSSNEFWNDLASELKASGQSLRSDVRSKLDTTNRDDKRCQDLIANRDVEGVKGCVSKFTSDLERLEALR